MYTRIMCIVDCTIFLQDRLPDMLTSFNVLTPGNIRFGRGLARSAAPWLAGRSAQILLVHGASLQRAEFC